MTIDDEQCNLKQGAKSEELGIPSHGLGKLN
jgi:hypothetical protein